MVTEVAETHTSNLTLPGMMILVHEAEEGGYWGEVYGFPGCVSQGETLEELRINMQEAFESVRPYSEAVEPEISYLGLPQTWTQTHSIGIHQTFISTGGGSVMTR